MALAYNVGDFPGTLALPETAEHLCLTTLLTELIKVGAKVVRHCCYLTYQPAEVGISKALFAGILQFIPTYDRSPAAESGANAGQDGT